MASTSLTLGEHWQSFIDREIESGRYTSASEVVRAALRELEERNERLQALRDHLAPGAEAAARGDFVESMSAEEIVARAKARTKKR